MSAAPGVAASTSGESCSENSSVCRTPIRTTHTSDGTLNPISPANLSAFCNEVSWAEVVCPAECS